MNLWIILYMQTLEKQQKLIDFFEKDFQLFGMWGYFLPPN